MKILKSLIMFIPRYFQRRSREKYQRRKEYLLNIMEERSLIDVDRIMEQSDARREIVEVELGYPSLWRRLKELLVDSEDTPIGDVLSFALAMRRRGGMYEVRSDMYELFVLTRMLMHERFPDLHPVQFCELPDNQLRMLETFGFLQCSIRRYPLELPPKRITDVISCCVTGWNDENATALLTYVHDAHVRSCERDLRMLFAYYQVCPSRDLTASSIRVAVPSELRESLGRWIYESVRSNILRASTIDEALSVWIPCGSYWGSDLLPEMLHSRIRVLRERQEEGKAEEERKRVREIKDKLAE